MFLLDSFTICAKTPKLLYALKHLQISISDEQPESYDKMHFEQKKIPIPPGTEIFVSIMEFSSKIYQLNTYLFGNQIVIVLPIKPAVITAQSSS